MMIIPDILAEHLEEIEFLWSQRHDALRSEDYQPHELIELDQRINAHLQGLLVGGEHCIEFAKPMLCDDDPAMAFAGAWCLMHVGHPQLVIDEIEACNLDGVIEAFCNHNIGPVKDQLLELYGTSSELIASAIGVVLATHSVSPRESRLQIFFASEAPEVRRRAWEIVSRSNTV